MERFQHTANLLIIVQTCYRQGRSVIGFFEQTIKVIANDFLKFLSWILEIYT